MTKDYRASGQTVKTKKPAVKMTIIAIAVAVAVMVITYLAYLLNKEFRESVISQSQQRLLTIAEATSIGLEGFIAEHARALRVVSMNPLFQERVHNKLKCEKPAEGFCHIRNLYEAHKNDVSALTLLDVDGIMLHREPFIEDRPGMDHSDKPGVAYIIGEHKAYVSEVFYNNLGNLAISVLEPIFYEGQFAGSARWMIEVDTLSKRFVETVKIGKRGFAWIFDDANRILSYPRKDCIGMSVLDVIKKTHQDRGGSLDEGKMQEHIRERHDYLNKVRTEEAGYGIFPDCATDENEIIAYKKIVLGGLTLNLIMSLPYSEIVGPIYAHQGRIVGLAGLVILLLGAGGLALLGSEKQRAQLQMEAKYLKQISSGAEALKKSEEQFRTVADFAYDWEYWMNPGGELVYVSPSCERITGYSPDEYRKDPGLIEKISHPDDLELASNHLKSERHGGEAQSVEFRIITRSGEKRWIGHVCQPVYSLDGTFIGRRGTNRDITKRKDAEEERNRLIQKLQEALAKVKTLSGLLPICSSCKKIRDDKGYWNQIEAYIRDHSEAEFSHGICPECARKLYPDWNIYDKDH